MDEKISYICKSCLPTAPPFIHSLIDVEKQKGNTAQKSPKLKISAYKILLKEANLEIEALKKENSLPEGGRYQKSES